ncbi:aromatic-ring-hydroxylating dioxygenase subunit alpha [Aliidongia dinghuensis]|uniref:Aromatic-ring-hydroxylating dioxygenase subunit alpha n=1 Tax=Aliidongia dinghuensis TaxID=1867774 RepID=A0A8J2Z237_9PROT|nr:aromatic ring-hydroxylating dioxygenase subunit alpha [Aliidongia dinghuensis]GGF49467.1 aromatic-ring-hydroxylating dioxygenase subunit alpha [Aliidongia dinghuensis]
MATMTIPKKLVVEDAANGTFKVARSAFTSQEIFERERDLLFGKCWLFLGHESELPNPNDFLTRTVAGKPLIFNRDRKGEFHALFNSCPHRGAQVAREACGNALAFKCFYHGWAFNNNGKYATRSPEGCYPKDFGADGHVDLARVPQLASYAGFWFVNFDADAPSLDTYLGGAKAFLDLVSQHSGAGMEFTGGVQHYSIRANWKLLVENSIDGYHASETHSTYFQYLMGSIGSVVAKQAADMADTTRVHDFCNGSVVIEGVAPWGRPIARPIPAWGEQGKRDCEALIDELRERLGEERALQIATRDRNMVVFPNLVINDIMAITVRTFYPVSPDLMYVTSWALAPKDEDTVFRKRRLDNFLEFLGPGGFATPDDVEALESAQRGYANEDFAGWNDISRGMTKERPAGDDEEQMRCFWREWSRRMENVK